MARCALRFDEGVRRSRGGWPQAFPLHEGSLGGPWAAGDRWRAPPAGPEPDHAQARGHALWKRAHKAKSIANAENEHREKATNYDGWHPILEEQQAPSARNLTLLF